jgi:putative peptidoglycan lipid II flippase
MGAPPVEVSAAAAPEDDVLPADIVGRHRRLVRRTALISTLTLLSRLLGYGREFLSALLFGHASPIYDAFVTAWRVPNLFRRLLGEGAVSTALQTALTETDGDLGDEAGRVLFWETLRLALWILLGVCALVMGVVGVMGDTMPFTGWHWLGEEPAAVRELTLRVVPYVIFICLAGLCAGALAVRGRFAAASASGGVMNLVAILTLVLVGLRFGWSGPAPEDGWIGRARHMDMARIFSWGLVLSGVAQLLILVPDLLRSGLLGGSRKARGRRPRPRFSAAAVLGSSAPLALGAAVYQINVMMDGLMAQGMLESGGPTTYYFANRIQQLPLGLVATAATSAVFPALKALGHRRELRELRSLHDRTHLAIAFVALPATAGIIVLAEPIVATLLQHGEFGAEGVRRTASALRVLALALLPAGAAGLVTRTYYALGDFKAPVRVAAWMLGLNVLLNVAFLAGLGMDVAGLSLSTAIVSWTNLGLLVPGLRRRMPPEGGVPGGPRMSAGLARMVLTSGLCALAAWGTRAALGGEARSPLPLAIAILAGLGTYVIASQALGVAEWAHVRARLAGWLRRGHPPASKSQKSWKD